ncbi:stage II sporulation protein M [Paenibacillus sp. YIM B09110]|uniref:stage II sporulation protein M n=1 Tax=Paenibacillus sp. YIM B09110 TaxID=3126102 RepID=UPI00301E5B26
MFKKKSIIDHLKQMNPYIAFGFILFFAGMVIGGTNPVFHAFLNNQLAGLSGLADVAENSDNPTLTLSIIIFLNNAIKAVFVMYLGAFFGIIPLLFIVVNGMLIGFLLQNIAAQEGAGYMASVVLKGILPHGIIEIPAIIIACAYGMKFGTLGLRGFGSLLFSRSKLPAIGKEYEIFVSRTVPMIVILPIAMLVASIIESTLSVWLLSL